MRTFVVAFLLCAGVFWATLNKGRMADAWTGVEKSLLSFLGSSRNLDEDQAEEPEEGRRKVEDSVERSALLALPTTLAAPEPSSADPAFTSASASETPASAVTVTTVAAGAEPALPVYLPADQFYARERLVETTATGTTAIPAGKLVRKVAEKGGIYLVEDIETATRLRIEPWKLTRDVKQVPDGAGGAR